MSEATLGDKLVVSDAAQLAVRRVAIVSVLAVMLGLAMQGFVLGGKLAAGAPLPGLDLALDITQGVTWSFLVCAGVSVGAAVTRGKAVLAGLIAAVFAPIALALAKAAQKVMAGVTKAAGSEPVLSLGAIAGFRAVEYGLLGWLLAVLVQKGESRLRPYVAAGAGVGLIVGGSFVATSYWVAVSNGSPLAMPALAGITINEVVFPIGCSIVIYLGQMIARNLKLLGEQK
ncbi:MAG: hypothetical protein AB7I79_11440 [Rhizobiaceae bacterium]